MPMTTTTTIYFDMDGTIADLYSYNGWLELLRSYDSLPYKEAGFIGNAAELQYILMELQAIGVRLGVISWLSKGSIPQYDKEVREAKKTWLKEFLPKIIWDEIHLVRYGTPKQKFTTKKNDNLNILFDDNEEILSHWERKRKNNIGINPIEIDIVKYLEDFLEKIKEE